MFNRVALLVVVVLGVLSGLSAAGNVMRHHYTTAGVAGILAALFVVAAVAIIRKQRRQQLQAMRGSLGRLRS